MLYVVQALFCYKVFDVLISFLNLNLYRFNKSTPLKGKLTSLLKEFLYEYFKLYSFLRIFIPIWQKEFDLNFDTILMN